MRRQKDILRAPPREKDEQKLNMELKQALTSTHFTLGDEPVAYQRASTLADPTGHLNDYTGVLNSEVLPGADIAHPLMLVAEHCAAVVAIEPWTPVQLERATYKRPEASAAKFDWTWGCGITPGGVFRLPVSSFANCTPSLVGKTKTLLLQVKGMIKTSNLFFGDTPTVYRSVATDQMDLRVPEGENIRLQREKNRLLKVNEVPRQFDYRIVRNRRVRKGH